MAALAGIVWAAVLLSYNPDECNWLGRPTHAVETTIAIGGLAAGLLIRQKRWRKGILAVAIGAVLIITGAAIYWHLTLHDAYCYLRLRFAVGLQVAFVLGFVAYALSVAFWRPERAIGSQRSDRISACFLPVLLVLIAGVHFAGANWIMPRLGLLRMIVCLDEESGQELWRHGFPTTKLERIVPATSYATPTPVSDGKRVFAYFGPAGVLCVDHNGVRKWLNSHLPFKTDYGAATSPLVFEDQLILVSDSYAGSFVAGIDSETGQVRWKTARPIPLDSYGTPVLYRYAEQARVLVAGAGTLASYDAKTGEEMWIRSLGRKTNHGDSLVIQSPLIFGDTIFVGGTYRGQRLFAFKHSDVRSTSDAQELWRTTKPVLGYASPVLCSNLLFTVDNMGIASCISVDSGEIYWRERLGGSFAASPSVFQSHVIFLSEQGTIVEVSVSREFHVFSRYQTRFMIVGSPAFRGDRMFFRTPEGICCFEKDFNPNLAQ